jgi:hypothetical protein
MLANKTALAIPAFVDLFTRQLRWFRCPSADQSKSGFRSTDSARSLLTSRKARSCQGYLRRDFAFAVAMTANGGATVMNTRTNTINKTDMTFPTFFGSVWNRTRMLRREGDWPSLFGMW